jgi:hypothetical protein
MAKGRELRFKSQIRFFTLQPSPLSFAMST